MSNFRCTIIACVLAVTAFATAQNAASQEPVRTDGQSWRERLQERRAQQKVTGQDNTASYKEYSLMHDGQERWYMVHAPKTLQSDAAAVVLLHGGTQSMRKMFQAEAASGRAWRDLADRDGVLLIIPNGVNPDTGDAKGDRQNWNDFRKPGSPRNTDADDVGFITSLVDKMIEDYQLDPKQIFVTGASNGGMMTYRLLIDKPEVFAAGAAFIANFPEGNMSSLRQPSRPTPIMIMNGTEDPLIPYDGGDVGPNLVSIMSTAETVDWWVKANNAAPTSSAPYNFPDVNTEDDCTISLVEHAPQGENSAPVHLYTMHGGGHIVPSQKYIMRGNRITERLIGQQCYDVEGAEVAWEFFQNAR